MTARALLGLFFIYFGLDKFVNYGDTGVYMSAFGIPALFLPLIIILEIVGGIALLVGWQLKRVAGLLAGFTALTALIFHSDFAEPVQVILFMKNMAITGGLLLFIATGAGQLSIDAQIANKNKKVKKTR
jgi:putative oxidoreductase